MCRALYLHNFIVTKIFTIHLSPFTFQPNQLFLPCMQYTLKKSLGQHFLKDETICRKIVDTLQQSITNTAIHNIVEVGPGAGAITKFILQIPGIDFKAVELDTEKVAYLEHTYPLIKDKIIHQDFLDTDAPYTEPFIVIGNFPYNISTQIVFKVIEWKEQVPVMIGMFQKEVAQRIASKPGSKVYGIMSVLVQAFYQVEYLFDVPPESFNPAPKVMSGVIKLTRKKEQLTIKSERSFFVLVKTAFNQRRKTLRNAVRSLFSEDELKDDIFNKRAEQLSIDDFAALTFRMQ
jgi:16S rRNA (adenine1518-N6/adenine1519-N6)-dimethyltransferase